MPKLLGRALVRIVGKERVVPKFDQYMVSPSRKISSPDNHPLIAIHRSINGIYVRSPATPFPENYSHARQDIELSEEQINAVHKLTNTIEALTGTPGFRITPSVSRHRGYCIVDGERQYINLLNFTIEHHQQNSPEWHDFVREIMKAYFG